jgi:hypothetical protein
MPGASLGEYPRQTRGEKRRREKDNGVEQPARQRSRIEQIVENLVDKETFDPML